MFPAALNLPANAQDKDTCKDCGWTSIDRSQIDLSGTWTGNQNRNCRESASWQYSSFPIEITQDGGVYYGKIGSEDKTEIEIQGGRFTWTGDLRKSAGPDNNKVYFQTWTGTLERSGNGEIRIYGTWSGAYSYLKQGDRNLDFLIIK